jgi:hypothetical protein
MDVAYKQHLNMNDFPRKTFFDAMVETLKAHQNDATPITHAPEGEAQIIFKKKIAELSQ